MNGFDRLAKPYRWMEYATFGPFLERCRFRFLPEVQSVRSALLLGDGDGRYTAALLRTAPCHATAVDGSPAMLRALRHRCAQVGDTTRLNTQVADLRAGLPEALEGRPFDLIATHFFLDCLSSAEADRVVRDATTLCTEDARWVVSEFAVPARGAMRLPSRALVRALYLAFRLLTGLRAQELPRYRDSLILHGWQQQVETKQQMGGLLVSELWERAAPKA